MRSISLRSVASDMRCFFSSFSLRSAQLGSELPATEPVGAAGGRSLRTPYPPSQPPQAALPNPFEEGLVAGKGQAVDADKWCALCERDGHDATACPFDDIL